MVSRNEEHYYIEKVSNGYGECVENILNRFPETLRGLKGAQVLVKPNMWFPHRSGSGSITDVRLVREVVRCALDAGAKKVVVGDGAAVGYAFKYNHNSHDVFKKAGLRETLREFPVEIRDLNNGPFVEIKDSGFHVFDSMRVARSAVTCDCLINLPVLKTHLRTRVSLSMKNLKGVLAPGDKKKCHRVGLDQGIVDLNSVVHSNLIIVDANNCMEGLWEYPRDRVELGLLLGASDPLLADSMGACLMGIDPALVRHLSLARERGLFSGEMVSQKQIPECLVRKFTEASDALKERFPHTLIDIAEACTGCYGSITAPLIQLNSSGVKDDLKNMAIFSGYMPEPDILEAHYRSGKRVLLVGKCAVPERAGPAEGLTCINGCPPSARHVEEVITGRCTGKEGSSNE